MNFKKIADKSFTCHISKDNSDDFYLVTKGLVIAKKSNVKIQNHVENHESRPVKSNPGILTTSVIQEFCKRLVYNDLHMRYTLL